jgi:hypothetical protein
VHIEAHGTLGTVIIEVVSCFWLWGSSVGWRCSSDDVADRGLPRAWLVSSLGVEGRGLCRLLVELAYRRLSHEEAKDSKILLPDLI